MDEEAQADERLRHPLSIALLFHLVTLSAIVAACARYLDLGGIQSVPWNWTAGLVLSGAVIGFLIGVILSFFRPLHQWLPPLLGVLIGLTSAPLLLIPIKNHWHIMSISFVGCWILIVFSLLVARFRDDPIVTRR